MSLPRTFSVSGQVALHFLQLATEALGAIPTLKSVAADALQILQLVKGIRVSQRKWQDFAEVLEEIARRIEIEQSLPQYKRLTSLMDDAEKIYELKERLNNAMTLFHLDNSITTMVDIHKVFVTLIQQQNDRKHAKLSNSLVQCSNEVQVHIVAQNTSRLKTEIDSISQEASLVSINTALHKLRRVQGASWNITQACLKDTRIDLVNRILAWINGETDLDDSQNVDGAKIMLLTGVAGSGKTAIAHTIAQKCDEKGLLVSSFFFNRNVQDRNNPTALFSTMAFDLGSIDNCFARSIAATIQEDPRILFASLRSQFDRLISKPCKGFSAPGPKVFVIDSLDEGSDYELLEILSDQIQYLPSSFRFFITSRASPEIDYLTLQRHVITRELSITSEANMNDIIVFIMHKLRLLAKNRNLEDDWPGETLKNQFISKAGGLFQWVTVICEYLHRRNDPTGELRKLLSADGAKTSTAYAQMDVLYASILESFDWTDQSFVDEYHRLVGMTLTAKAPLTISAMKELFNSRKKLLEERPLSHESTPCLTESGSPQGSLVVSSNRDFVSNYTLQNLSPLFTGLNKSEHNTHPVQAIHPSLCDFLMTHSAGLPRHACYQIREGKTTEDLAELCLVILNRELRSDLPIAGYLSHKNTQLSRVPTLSKETIPQALWYACQFWAEHVSDTSKTRERVFLEGISSSVPLGEHTEFIQQQLLYFLGSKLVLWLELTVACGLWFPIPRCRKSLLDKLGLGYMQSLQPAFQEYGRACMLLSDFLGSENRNEGSLQMLEEGIQRSTQALKPLVVILCSADSDTFGYSQEKSPALVYRELAIDRPLIYTPSEFATSFSRMAICLSSLYNHSEAIKAIVQSMQLYRKLATEEPSVHETNLSQSLATYFSCHSRIAADSGAPAPNDRVDPYVGKFSDQPPEPIRRFAPAECSSNQSGDGAYYCQIILGSDPYIASLHEAIVACSQLDEAEMATHALSFVSTLVQLSNNLVYYYQDELAIAILYEAVLCRNLTKARLASLDATLSRLLRDLDSASQRGESDIEYRSD